MLKRALAVCALGVLGALVAVIGAGSHRSAGYLGIVLALALVASAGIFAKAWESWAGFIAYASLWAAGTVYFGSKGPGNSVLVADDLKGLLWIYGGTTVMAIVAGIPRFVLVGRDVAP
jgi:hypothetical protein